MTLVDKGLVFIVPAKTPAAVFADVPLKVDFPARKYEVIFGTPASPQGSVSFQNIHLPAGSQQQVVTDFGKNMVIETTRIDFFSNVKFIDLGLV